MKLRYLASVFALLVSACTITPQGNGFNSELHPPLTYQDWQIEHYTLQDGKKACSISSGYNGITVAVIHKTNSESIYVKSNRHMNPGATFAVNTERANFETYETIFTAKASKALVDDLVKGGKAYLEWSEFSGPSTHERIAVQNIVRLDDFGAQLKQCRNSLLTTLVSPPD